MVPVVEAVRPVLCQHKQWVAVTGRLNISTRTAGSSLQL